MSKNENNNSLLFASGVILGAVVGGAMGILFAPAAGEETRKEISKRSKKAMKEIKKGAKDIGDKLEPTFKNVKKGISEKIEDVKEGFQKGAKAATKR